MIDWSVAERLAGVVVQEPPGGRALAGDLAAFSADAVARVTEYTGMVPEREIPPPEAITRREWVRANLGSMRTIMAPVETKLPSRGPLKAVMGAVTGAEVGVLVGYLGQRVLGQYELVLIDAASPERLLFVAPNLRSAAARLDVAEESLVAWVAFHEVTHAVQFTSVPWLRGHLAGLLSELLTSVDVQADGGSLLKLDLTDVRALVEKVRDEGLVTLAAGPERMAIIDQMQATMALIEGHAEHVMDAVGADALSDLDELRGALDRRRAERPPLFKIVERLLGLELKMKQYVLGKAFVDHVVEAGGIERLNVAWSSAEALPTLDEITAPDDWLARTA